MATNSSSKLLEYLPAIYQADPFIGKFLKAFETILLGQGNQEINFPQAGIEQTIANISDLFDPQKTPKEFLVWLAGWTAFSLRADLTVAQQRSFLARIITLYQGRGTKNNLQELLQIFTTGLPEIIEVGSAELQIAKNSTIGINTYIGGGTPHFFRVIIYLQRMEQKLLARQLEIARALIELEKPAHTHYELEYKFPSMQIGTYSTLGVDTVLGIAT